MTEPSKNDFTIVQGTTVRLRDFEGQFQAQPTWCWAATAASVHRYMMNYKEKKIAPTRIRSLSQCYFVDRQKGGRTCRKNRLNQLTDQTLNCQILGCSIRDQVETGYPEDALQDPNVDVHRLTLEQPITFTAIRREIDLGLPIIIRLANPDITFHIVTITGYDTSLPGLFLWDPVRGERYLSINGLQKRLGRWTHTILTKFCDGSREV